MQSQHTAPSENELPARTALTIARTLDDPALVAGGLAAMTLVVVDPLRRTERRAWIDELLALGDDRPDQPWRRWALPCDARERVLIGDASGALAVFAELEAATETANDIVGRHAASYGGLFATTIVGDWEGARAAAARMRQTSSEALLEDGAAILAEFGMLAIIDLLSGNTAAVVGAEAVADIEWPTPEMAAAANAAFGAMLAADGQLDGAGALMRITRRLLPTWCATSTGWRRCRWPPTPRRHG